MAEAARDENNVPTLTAVLDSDGSTVTRVKADPTNHVLSVDDNTTGSDNGPDRAVRDENFVTPIVTGKQ